MLLYLCQVVRQHLYLFGCRLSKSYFPRNNKRQKREKKTINFVHFVSSWLLCVCIIYSVVSSFIHSFCTFPLFEFFFIFCLACVEKHCAIIHFCHCFRLFIQVLASRWHFLPFDFHVYSILRTSNTQNIR